MSVGAGLGDLNPPQGEPRVNPEQGRVKSLRVSGGWMGVCIAPEILFLRFGDPPPRRGGVGPNGSPPEGFLDFRCEGPKKFWTPN